MNSNPEKPNEFKEDSSSYETESPSSSPHGSSPRRQSFSDQPYLAGDPRQKSPVLAIVLSLMPGLGQIYVGFYQQGFLNILVVASIISAMVRGVPDYLYPFLGLFLAFYWLYNLVDAFRRASFYNQALSGMTETPIPAEFRTLTDRGSLAGGTVLVLLGLFFFAHTRLGMPLEWLEQWWPMGLVGVGLFLLFQNIKDRKKSKEQ